MGGWGCAVRRFTAAGRRERVTRSATGALAGFYAAEPPDAATPTSELRLLAVDVETTGLDPGRDHLLSIGFVPVDGRRIDLGGARQILIRPDTGVGQSAAVHGLTDDVLADATPLDEALDEVLGALRGRVLLAHFARLETGFLSRACRRLRGAPLRCPVIDTMELQIRLLYKGFDDEPLADELRLWKARERYGLPRYRAHEALTDAVACAELYLAQTRELGGARGATLGALLRGRR